MSISKLYATGPATCKCSMGSAPAVLVPLSQQKLFVDGKLVLTEADKLTMPPTFITCVNIPTPAGPGPCAPALTMWSGTSTPETVNGLKILLKTSTISCALGGVVTLIPQG